jgi:hypothetical protein
MRWSGSEPSTVLLEMEGTANLALFRPLDWIGGPQGVGLRARLASADNVTQTIEKEGRRRLSLIQRQRWLIRVAGRAPGQRVGGFRLPVYDPEEHVWREARVEGVAPRDTGTGREGGTRAPQAGAGSRASPVRWGVALAAALAALAVLWPRVRRRGPGGNRMEDGIDVIEKRLKTSPRGFLDSVHRLLERRAAQLMRSHNLGTEDTPLDRCWVAVQRYRFTREPLPPEARDDILKTLREIDRPAGSPTA